MHIFLDRPRSAHTSMPGSPRTHQSPGFVGYVAQSRDECHAQRSPMSAGVSRVPR
jgi:hypothetical protein